MSDLGNGWIGSGSIILTLSEGWRIAACAYRQGSVCMDDGTISREPGHYTLINNPPTLTFWRAIGPTPGISMEELELVSQHIERLLSEKPFELCARLKQRLNLALHRAGYEAFDEGKHGYKKFSGFLRSELGDKLRFERPDGATGDLKISLKSASCPASGISAGSASKRARPIGIRPDIFLAFTNPDPTRKRFWDKQKRKVLHFAEGQDDKYAQIVASRPGDFVEIDGIPAHEQIGWMRDFLDLLAPEEKSAVEPLLVGEFSGGMNASFTNALGGKASEWRQMRQLNVSKHITAWDVKHGLKLADGAVSGKSEVIDANQEQKSRPQQLMSAREQAIGLLDRMTEDQIARVAIPALLSSFLAQPQI
ncbi:hypothetical protein D3C81_213050 [compost metagenome]